MFHYSIPGSLMLNERGSPGHKVNYIIIIKKLGIVKYSNLGTG